MKAVNRTIGNEVLIKRLRPLQWSRLKKEELQAIQDCLAGYGSVDVIGDMVESFEPIRKRIFPVPASTYRRAIRDQSK